ncbi:MAG TPA: hypothetical protein PKA20_08735, partial [Burkholderiaceae bacterium]|nr:hypothetical protein [Burkholderiaceae bacterium]
SRMPDLLPEWSVRRLVAAGTGRTRGGSLRAVLRTGRCGCICGSVRLVGGGEGFACGAAGSGVGRAAGGAGPRAAIIVTMIGSDALSVAR